MARLTSYGLQRFLYCPVNIVGLSFRCSLLGEVASGDRSADLFFRHAMRKCVDGVSEVDSVAIARITRILTKLIDALCQPSRTRTILAEPIAAPLVLDLSFLQPRPDIREKFLCVFVYPTSRMNKTNK